MQLYVSTKKLLNKTFFVSNNSINELCYEVENYETVIFYLLKFITLISVVKPHNCRSM